MLTREQWENLARFAGVDENTRNYGWYPRSDWNDFGPLWVKLEVWLGDGTTPDQPLRSATWDFECAKMEGDERQLMETGCLLGATIGATMGDKA